MKAADTRSTILVADDHPTNVGVLYEMLSHAGYRVLVAENGAAAVERARKGQPDLILLDVMMPEMDGFEACQVLKKDPATAAIPVIFATALADSETKTRAFQLGANDFLTKPLSRQPTLACVAKHLSRKTGKGPPPQPEAVHPANTEKSAPSASPGHRLKGSAEGAKEDPLVPTALHDLRGALGGALGFLESLEDELQEKTPALPTMRESCRWMRRALVSMEEALQVLTLGRGLSSHSLEIVPCALAEILKAAAERTSELLPFPALSLRGAEAAPTLPGDRVLLEQYFFLLFRSFLGLVDDVASVTVDVHAHPTKTGAPGITLELPGKPLRRSECAIFFRPFEEGKRQHVRNVGISTYGLKLLAQPLRIEATAEAADEGTRFHFTFPN